ncbi:hypothetical protein K439DRAFT_661667 [Ramaria rubella]|nr:hypothetical protein K439DRAFT_661667 [Ramaria rubella]
MDYLNLLPVGYVPSCATEFNQIKKWLDVKREEIRLIDVSIASLEEQIHDLRLTQVRLRRLCAGAEALMAPIRRLPDEILSKIFILLIPEVSLGRDQHVFNYHTHPHDVRLTLVTVCRHWAVVMDATPEAWSTIILNSRTFNEEQLALLLNKSRPWNIEVFVEGASGRCRRGFIPEWTLERYHTAMALIGSHMSRLRAFCGIRIRPLNGYFPLDHTWARAQNLRHLTLLSAESLPNFKLMDAPNLYSLSLGSNHRFLKYFPHSSRKSLRQLHLSFPGPFVAFLDVCVMFLVTCPNLEDLLWEAMGLGWGRSAETIIQEIMGPGQQVPMYSLKRFRFVPGNLGNLNSLQLFMQFQMPRLESLELVQQTSMQLEALNSALSNGLSNLRELSLDTMTLVGSQSGNHGVGKRHISNLIRLTLSDCNLPPLFFTMFTSHSITSSQPKIFTKLGNIHLLHCDFKILDLSNFLDYHARTTMDTLRAVYIKTKESTAEARQNFDSLLMVHGDIVNLL